MKTVKITCIIFLFLTILSLEKTSGQWAFNGTNIFNTNGGYVGIGTSTPVKLLDVLRNATEPTIRIFNTGGTGGATFQMTDYISGADWKFKATAYGGFKIRDNAHALDVMTIEPNTAANSLYIGAGGNVTIGTDIQTSYVKFQSNQNIIHGIAVSGVSTYTSGSCIGVHGETNTISSAGAGGYFIANNNDGDAPGIYGRADGSSTNTYGVAGHAYFGGTGVGAWSYTGDLFRGFDGDFPGGTLRFYVTRAGAVFADGGYNTFKKALLAGGKEEYRSFRMIESTEGWVEDIGSFEMIGGEAVVKIDPVYASSVKLDNDYKVFLTPVSEDIVNLVITKKDPESFRVKGVTNDGRPANCSFDYRIVAKDRVRNYGRMEPVDIPDAINISRIE
ncbi:MAG: hypothetical protein RBS55_10610 [Bacteroidales bacterium]|jgi:hypothetical protein|nr:hypothetical protein [Bacteroidales bacterium]